jgi:hypothetical protein
MPGQVDKQEETTDVNAANAALRRETEALRESNRRSADRAAGPSPDGGRNVTNADEKLSGAARKQRLAAVSDGFAQALSDIGVTSFKIGRAGDGSNAFQVELDTIDIDAGQLRGATFRARCDDGSKIGSAVEHVLIAAHQHVTRNR